MIIKPTIKLTEMCNFKCSYCEYKAFAFTQKQHLTIEPQLAISIAKQCIMHNYYQSALSTNFCWHGGEPLLYPKKDFCYILDEINSFSFALGMNCFNSIQTNGYLIDQDWLNIFEKYDIKVGVSIDGPESINELQREKNSTKKVIENIERLKQINCFSGVLTVLTENHKNKEQELFDFYKTHNINKVGFCKAFNSDLSHTVTNETLSKFLITFFDIYSSNTFPLEVREYKAYLSRILKRKTSNYCFTSCRNACGYFLTFNANGDVFICDDSYFTKNKISNIKSCSLINILSSEIFHNRIKETKKILLNCCNKCDIKDICGCGCYRNDIDCFSKNYFCDTYKSLINHLQSYVDNLTKL